MSETAGRSLARLPGGPLLALLVLYGATAALAIWQGSTHPSPTIFTDELELTQLSRSIAATGEATIRGQPWGSAPLSAYLNAPVWRIADVATAYAVAKVLGALLMASVVFPAYALARLAVAPRWALFAAAGTGLAPALSYAPMLVTEPAAYPISTLALFLIVRFARAPSAIGLGAAAGACLLGLFARTQLAVLLVVLAASAASVVWRTHRFSSWRRRWTAADWIGAVLLAIGLAIVTGAYVSHRSVSWYTATTFFQDRMLEYGLWAAGALAIGLGILPFVAGLAAVVRPRGEAPDPGATALAVVTVSAAASFGFYTAVKAAYLSTQFAVLTLERNLIYLVPLLFAGTALVLQRRRVAAPALVAVAAAAVYLVATTPLALSQYPSYEAPGLSVAAFANRIFRWPDATIEQALVSVAIAGSIVLLLLTRRAAPSRAAAVAAALVAAGTLVWTGTAEVYAAHGESLFARRLDGSLPRPRDWLDRMTGGAPAVFLGQSITDPNPIYLLEFWNRSLRQVWSLDGKAPGPGPTVTPDLVQPDGTLTRPGADYLVASAGIDVAGRPLGRPVGGYRVYPLPGGRLRLASSTIGVYPDGWIGDRASFARYDVPPGERGLLRVVLSRSGWCGKEVRSTVLVEIGPVAVGSDRQPMIGKVTDTATGVIHSCQTLRDLVLRTPPRPWLVRVTIDPTFSPRKLDPTQGDARELGATVSLRYRRLS